MKKLIRPKDEPNPNCTAGMCNKTKACHILGQCAYEHPLIKSNPAAAEDLKAVHTTKHIVQVFNKHTVHRMLIGSYRNRGYFIYPGQFKLQGKGIAKRMKKAKRKKMKDSVKAAPAPALDPVTQLLYKVRLTKAAIADANAGYIFSEEFKKHFHE